MQILKPDGVLVPGSKVPLSAKKLVPPYRNMLLARVLDEKLVALQRQGRMGTYVSSSGQEACQIGSTLALRDTDWIFPMYRDLATMIQRGVPVEAIMNKMFGNAEDGNLGRDLPNSFGWRRERLFSLAAPIASHLQVAVGFAMAAAYRKDDAVTLSFFGDGATSSSEFHVALNFAGVYKVQTIFLCENNQYAISVPVTRQTASETIAGKAAAYGLEGVRVDGNDLLAVYQSTRNAAEKARSGAGSTLIECLTYRLGAHSTSDDWKKYRTTEEVEEWRKRDPLVRMRNYLTAEGVWSESDEQKTRKELETQISAEISKGERIPPPPIESMFTDVYGEETPELRDEAKEEISSR